MVTDSGKVTLGKSQLKWSTARLPKEGETECGDLHLVKQFGDKILMAAVDGLGHGANAARASETAIRSLETFNNESIISLVHRCHEDLRSTRGAVMSLAILDIRELTLTSIGLGNVEGTLYRAGGENWRTKERIILRGGVVGYKLPSLQASIFSIENGDVLIFTTDGIDNSYIDNLNIAATVQSLVRSIASDFRKQSDDALILVARFNN